jgi:hypothetical protein
MNEGNGRMSTTKEGGKNYRRLSNELKIATDNAKNEYLENKCDEIIEFQRAGRYDLTHTKHKGSRLKRKPWDSKHWHQILSREYNNRSEKVL